MQWTLKKTLTLLVSVVFVSFLVFYAYYQSRQIIEGPVIILDSPAQSGVSATPLIDVSGTAIRAKELTLDGRQIFIDLEGKFSEKLLLAPGYNILSIVAKDGEGKIIEKTIEINYTGRRTPALDSLLLQASSTFASST